MDEQTDAKTKTIMPHYQGWTLEACANGVITDILGVNKTDVVVLDGSQYCHFNEMGCKWKNQTTLSVLYVQGEKTSNVAGGKNAHFYNLECKTLGDFVASVSKSVQIATPVPKNMFTKATATPTPPTNKISLSISDNDGNEASKVKIGEELFLNITGPGN
ncbi:unnamed protein product [Mytilus coruscus]|uniref:Uncharacterized protein n=1 Tax=Mytilus coruscus TaxID=42192 RepID=A0A6J8A652_MYTCO|nr:unnamed protein product [Mytilus coruscus]